MLRSLVALLLCLAGCQNASKRVVPKPSEITLENALEQIGRGLTKMHDAAPTTTATDGTTERLHLGLHPSEITVTFNISASGEDKQSLVVDAAAPAPTSKLELTKVGGEFGYAQTTSRGNQVTIKFANFLFAPKDTLLTLKTAEELFAMRIALEDPMAFPEYVRRTKATVQDDPQVLRGPTTKANETKSEAGPKPDPVVITPPPDRPFWVPYPGQPLPPTDPELKLPPMMGIFSKLTEEEFRESIKEAGLDDKKYDDLQSPTFEQLYKFVTNTFQRDLETVLFHAQKRAPKKAPIDQGAGPIETPNR